GGVPVTPMPVPPHEASPEASAPPVSTMRPASPPELEPPASIAVPPSVAREAQRPSMHISPAAQSRADRHAPSDESPPHPARPASASARTTARVARLMGSKLPEAPAPT